MALPASCPPWDTLTVEPFSAVPVSVGVLSFVRLSVAEAPESPQAGRSSAGGAGASWSIYRTKTSVRLL